MTPQQRIKIVQMLKDSGTPSGVVQILFLNPMELSRIKNLRRITDEHPGFSDLGQGRVFVPSSILDNPAQAKDLLLHEFGHFDANSANEDKAEDAAKAYRDRYDLWNSPRGKMIRAAQANATNSAMSIPTASYPIASTLMAPLSNLK